MLKHFSTHIILSVLLVFFFSSQSQKVQAQSDVDWLTWEEAVEKSKVEKKKIFVDIYTDWCGWCKKMTRMTFNDPVIANYLNRNFYPVKFNGESKETIEFKEKEYKFIKSGRRGYHELAAWLMRGKMGYPTVVFLDEEFKIIQPIPGFLPSEKFEPIMTYFGGGHYKKTPWELYQKKYNNSRKKDAIPAND